MNKIMTEETNQTPQENQPLETVVPSQENQSSRIKLSEIKASETKQISHFEEFEDSFKKHIKKILIYIVIILLIAGAAYGSFKAYKAYSNNQKSLTATIQEQNKQAADLANQLNSLRAKDDATQQQNVSDVQDLKSQLDAQKVEAQKAQDQAQMAQKALTTLKQQSQSSNTQPIKASNTFPTINTKAIVLIACFDSLGNELQSGSGTIINSNGYVLTNRHVVTDSYGDVLSCGAFMNDGGSAPALQTATIYTLSTSEANTGFISNYDAAVLKITAATDIKTGNDIALPNNFPYITPHGGGLKQGDALFIFGYPAASNLVFNVSSGIVSSFTSDNNFINTDAIIDHGNSGGAAITADGRFVGIPTQKYYSQDGDYIGQILKVENLTLPN